MSRLSPICCGLLNVFVAFEKCRHCLIKQCMTLALILIICLIKEDVVNAKTHESLSPQDYNDLKLNGELYQPSLADLHREKRAAGSNRKNLWTENENGIPTIPYRFADRKVNKQKVKAALGHWAQNSCLLFKEIDKSFIGPHVNFKNNRFCSSEIGMAARKTGQTLNLHKSCVDNLERLVHEIGHMLGLHHTTLRTDRDDHVKINFANINRRDWFQIGKHPMKSDNTHDLPYDYNSVMHYDPKFYTKNGKTTITTLNPLYQGLIGRTGGLSHMDKLMLNRVYSCIEKNLANCSLLEDPCQNYGFLDKDCQCVCHAGTSGAKCEILNKSYNEIYMSKFSEKITEEGTVSSPLYPKTTPRHIRYTKWIVAPKCKQIKLTMNVFKGVLPYYGQSYCYWEGLEIRTDNMDYGNWYCHKDIKPGQEFLSSSSEMILFFHAFVQFSHAKWSASIQFVDDPNCNNN